MESSNDINTFNSAQTTPRSISPSASSSSRSLGSCSNRSSSSNYSFQQRNVTIPSDIRRVDVAVLSSPLVQKRYPEKLAPLVDARMSDVTISSNLPYLANDILQHGIEAENLKPHPPKAGKPKHRTRRNSQRSLSSQSTSDHDVKSKSGSDYRRSSNSSRESLDLPHVSDVEVKSHTTTDQNDVLQVGSSNAKIQSSSSIENPSSLQVSNEGGKFHAGFDKDLAKLLQQNFDRQRADIEKRNNIDHAETSDQDARDSNSNAENIVIVHQPSSAENEELHIRKSGNESLLIKSYENYLRQMSQNDEDFGSEASSLNQNGVFDHVLADAEDSSSDGNSDSSISSVSVSSLSSDEKTLTLNSKLDSSNKMELLYSLPIKEKKNDNHLKPLDSEKKLPLHSSILSGASQLNYAILDESQNDSELRTQSLPDLRTGRSFRTLDTMGYMCPLGVHAERRNTSSPELKKYEFGLKYRPLPGIPIKNSHSAGEKMADDHEPEYEEINTIDINSSPSNKPKVTFKAVANRLVSLMPRLTTKQARSREADRYMADILQYLPDQTLRVYCGTWNMKGIKVVPESLDDYILPQESIFIQDIYAIGCQEGTPFRKEWEIRLQETLGPTHVLLYSGNFGVLHLSIFVRRELVWFCTGIEQDTVATRIAHKFKTKGAIAVCFNLFGTSLLFINSHFASNQEKLKERVNDYRTIIRSLNIPFGEDSNNLKESDVTSRFDRVFWFGDFNFRVNMKRSETDEIFSKRDFPNQEKRKTFIIKELIENDQLCHLLSKGKIFHGFSEAPINFLPTYKFDVNTDTYDTSSKARVPSWTDRILYKSKHPDLIKVTSYSSCTTIKCSDHRPVFCIMDTKIEPASRSVQLPGAMFDRDIYIEANLRRTAPKGTQHASNVCTIL